MPRLHRLAEFFGVPVGQLLPQDETISAIEVAPSGGVTIDLNRLDSLGEREAELMENFLRAVQMMRQDFNGKVLTIRRNDLRLLALLLNQSEGDFSKKLVELGVTAG